MFRGIWFIQISSYLQLSPVKMAFIFSGDIHMETWRESVSREEWIHLGTLQKGPPYGQL